MNEALDKIAELLRTTLSWVNNERAESFSIGRLEDDLEAVLEIIEDTFDDVSNNDIGGLG